MSAPSANVPAAEPATATVFVVHPVSVTEPGAGRTAEKGAAAVRSVTVAEGVRDAGALSGEVGEAAEDGEDAENKREKLFGASCEHVLDGVLLVVPVADAEVDVDGVGVCVGVGNSVAAPEPDSDGVVLGAAPKLGVDETVAGCDGVSELEGVGDTLAVGVCDGVEEGETVAAPVCGGVAVVEAVPLLPLGEPLPLHVAVPDAVADSDAVCEPVGVGDALELPVGVADDVGLAGNNALDVADSLDELVPVAQLVAVPEGVPDGELVAAAVASALAVIDGVSDGVPLGESEDVLDGDALTVAVTLAVTVAATITVPPTLNPSDAEYAAHADAKYRKLHGSPHGAACRKTGHVQIEADAALPHLMVDPAPLTTSAYRVLPAGTVSGEVSVIVVSA